MCPPCQDNPQLDERDKAPAGQPPRDMAKLPSEQVTGEVSLVVVFFRLSRSSLVVGG
jgi:hypothetical protein